MRLLLLTTVFPNPYEPTKGPFNRELVRALSSAHEVRVVVPVGWRERRGRPSASPDALRVSGVEIAYPTYYYPPGIARSWYGACLWQSVRGTLARWLETWRPDAVLSYWAHPDGEVGNRIARRAGVPSILMVGGSDVLLLTEDPVRRRAIVRVLAQADAVLTVGGHLRGRLGELGIAPTKVRTFYRGVDPQRFAPGDQAAARQRLGLADEGELLLWVGRMVPVKGLDVLIDALGRLASRGRRPGLALVGDGPERTALERQCREAGVAQQVRFVGSVPHDALADWYRAADLTVLPSRSEGIANVLLESHACGTPFVASHVGSLAEVADAAWDRLVTPGDPAALAQALEEALAARTARGAISTLAARGDAPAAFARESSAQPPPQPGWDYRWSDAAAAVIAAIEPLRLPTDVWDGCGRASTAPDVAQSLDSTPVDTASPGAASPNSAPPSAESPDSAPSDTAPTGATRPPSVRASSVTAPATRNRSAR